MGARVLWPIVAVLLLGSAAVAPAQNIATSFEQLKVLVKPGDTVTVRGSDGTEVSGRIDRLSAASLTLLTPERASREFLETEVSAILQRRSDSLKNGALWGFGAGLGTGLALLLAVCSEDDECGVGSAALFAFVYGAMGTGIGVGVDALVVRRQPIYQRTAGAIGVSLTPLVTPARQDLAVSVRF